MSWESFLNDTLSEIKRKNLFRSLRPLKLEGDAFYLEGKKVDIYSSNDYLGFSNLKSIRLKVEKILTEFGMGPRGSALICGYTGLHEELERSLSYIKKGESALVFPSGFSANLAVIGAIAGDDLEIFSDELNHASMIDACTNAKKKGSKLSVYKHNDCNHLENLLKKSNASRKLILTETIFSMEGDRAELKNIADLKERYDALMMVDEAHASLIYGKRGGGLCQELGLGERVEIQLGTLSKAFAGLGGYVVCSKSLRDLIINRGRSFIYSTAIPLPMVAQALAAIEEISADSSHALNLKSRIKKLAEGLERPALSPIFSLQLNDEDLAMKAASELLKEGFHVIGIRPPTVPVNTSRLRITASANQCLDRSEELISFLRRRYL